MPKVTFEGGADGAASAYSTGTGSVVRGEATELARLSFAAGTGADEHAHPEEQVTYVLSGHLRVTCGDDAYQVALGEATFNPADVRHCVNALEDTTVLSFKSRVGPVREAAAASGAEPPPRVQGTLVERPDDREHESGGGARPAGCVRTTAK